MVAAVRGAEIEVMICAMGCTTPLRSSAAKHLLDAFGPERLELFHDLFGGVTVGSPSLLGVVASRAAARMPGIVAEPPAEVEYRPGECC